MLVVATGKLRDPVLGFVQMESDDGLLHPWVRCLAIESSRAAKRARPG